MVPLDATEAHRMTDQHDRALIERFVTAYNAFDLETMVGLVAPDIVFENHAGDTLTDASAGIDGFRSLAERATRLFSQREQRIRSIEGRDGWYVVSVDYVGQLAEDVPNGPPAGTRIEMSGTSEYLIEAGRIVKLVDRS
jgi:ketosteroid isomerase-like protein